MYCYKHDGSKKTKCEFCIESENPVQLYCNKFCILVARSQYVQEDIKAPEYCPKQRTKVEFWNPLKELVDMKWVITEDHITTAEDIKDGILVSRVGYGGDTKADGVQEGFNVCKVKSEDLPYAFKLYDDDGELYYEGRSNNRASEFAFYPLDWAMEDSGCTYIEYLQDNGKWEML